MEKKALGKGLQALLPEKKTLVWKVEQDGQAISMVALKQIIPNRYQPRTIFIEDELEGLSFGAKAMGCTNLLRESVVFERPRLPGCPRFPPLFGIPTTRNPWPSP